MAKQAKSPLNSPYPPITTASTEKATIHIICGGTTITVIIEQKGETENGEAPDEDSPADGVRKISEIITSTDGEPNHIVFTYDEQGRVQEYSLYKEISGQKKQNTWRLWLTQKTGSSRKPKLTTTVIRQEQQPIRYPKAVSVKQGRKPTISIVTPVLRLRRQYDQIYRKIYDYDGKCRSGRKRTGATVEVLDSTVTTYIWQNGVVKTMHYYPEDNVSNDIITSEFEYYDLDEIPPLPSVIKLQYYPEESGGWRSDFIGL